jgi:hypothetical protein
LVDELEARHLKYKNSKYLKYRRNWHIRPMFWSERRRFEGFWTGLIAK